MIWRFWTVPNQLTLARLIFVPFVITNVLDYNFKWALGLFIAAGLSDGLDGLLARWLKQRSTLGEYLDPIADKLLLSSLFLVLSFRQIIPWRFTVVVFSRDICILMLCALIYVTTPLRDFRPSFLGKLNTVAQVGALFLVLLNEVVDRNWIYVGKDYLLWTVFALTCLSALHYLYLVGYRLHQVTSAASK
ncbi:CDP-alcohol phosphatidyltransferase [Candidatus Koribacter versatilis Ellin345]|uniref:CDP-diacylglycerol--glycerol-3-phosphate 3-phosphatidyltransferase n=1 Tax=Koribacter versatilis (strain Ellin345) TaxID=204669 RepID=Q1IJF5_KORVE|nr:CDP-alcohol phosphatidyltransferase family protein [Candidatus Koribacter versatilis]ABF42995.1 CDP-alcohol phosphatidyltransferase [Candidatus Koribacter versatilis Ellin345]